MWKLLSPSARYEIRLSEREAFNSHWVHTPSLLDRETGDTLTVLSSNWSLDESEWPSASVVRLTVRKYPGNHTPADVVAVIDCEARTAKVGEREPVPLQALEACLDNALTWIHAQAPEPRREMGILEALSRFFKR